MKRKMRKWQATLFIVLTLSIMFWIVFVNNQIVASADFWGLFEKTNDEAKAILVLYEDYLVQGNVIYFMLRWLGWLLILILERGVSIFSQANIDILNLGNFAEASSFADILKQLEGLKELFLLFALVLLFFLMMMGKKVEFSQAMSNLMTSMIIVMALPFFVTTMLSLATDVGTGLNRGTDDVGIGQKTVLDNTADLTVFAENNWIDPDKIKKKNELPNIKYVRITQQITKPEEFGGNGVLGYNLDFVNGQEVAASFDPDVGFGKRWAQDLIGEGYYRWHVNFITTIVILAALNVAYILSGIRMGRLMIELAFNQGFATILAFADFRTMTRLKQVLFNIIGILCVIVAIFCSFALFSAFCTFIINSGLVGVPYAFAMVGAIWFVIDGPTIVQKVLGIDAGISSAWGLVGGAMGVKAAVGVGKAGVGVAGAAASLAAQGAAYLGGAGAGAISNIADGLADGLNKKKDGESPDKKDDKEEGTKGLNESKENGNGSDGLNENEGNEPSESNLNETEESKGEEGSPHTEDDQSEGLSSQPNQEENDENKNQETKGLNAKSDESNPESKMPEDKGTNTLSDKDKGEESVPLEKNNDKGTLNDTDNRVNSSTSERSSSPLNDSLKDEVKPTLSNQMKQKASNTKVGKAAKAGYKLTKKPIQQEDEK
ncbi:TPA: pLS20_p028 family conjugation system transmembrane protein [Listeria monocytogenes]